MCILDTSIEERIRNHYLLGIRNIQSIRLGWSKPETSMALLSTDLLSTDWLSSGTGNQGDSIRSTAKQIGKEHSTGKHKSFHTGNGKENLKTEKYYCKMYVRISQKLRTSVNLHYQ